MAPKKDISGQTYGYLKAIRCTGDKKNRSYLWEFECILCGKHIIRRIGLVTGGEIISCGCYKARNLKNRPLPDKVGQVLGTNISRITSKKPQSNTSWLVCGTCETCVCCGIWYGACSCCNRSIGGCICG